MALRSLLVSGLGVSLLCALGCPAEDGEAAGTTGVSTTGGTACVGPGCATVDDGGTTAASLTGAMTQPGNSDTSPPGTTGEASTGDEDPGSTGGDTTGGARLCTGEFPAMWNDGTDCAAEPSIQIHAYDANTVILRQSLCTSFEGPFMYLLFGEDRVLLQDTGDGGIPLADTVYGVIDDWLAANGKASIELIVTNSHAHGDHVQGNPQFVGQPNTQVVGYDQGSVSTFFGIVDWATDTATYDLGGRALEIIPIPGHEANHVAIYDHGTGWLLTGDTLYPGRLYISDFAQYEDSIGRLVDFTEGLEVCQVMGTHIEMTSTPGVDFDFGADAHPNEHELELTRDHLVELRDAVEAMNGVPQQEVHDDFIIYPL